MTPRRGTASQLLEHDALLDGLRRHWHHAGQGEEAAHEIYHPDAVLEFPQSGARFDGVVNLLPWRRQYPAQLNFHIRRITRREDLVIAENLISYDRSPWKLTVNLLEFRADKIARERIYITDGWDAPECRAAWRSSICTATDSMRSLIGWTSCGPRADFLRTFCGLKPS